MTPFAYIGHEPPTAAHTALAERQSVQLCYVGYVDPFTVTPGWLNAKDSFIGVVVTHPAAAARLAADFEIGVFNYQDDPVIPSSFHIYGVWE
jgi:hypothetical protein